MIDEGVDEEVEAAEAVVDHEEEVDLICLVKEIGPVQTQVVRITTFHGGHPVTDVKHQNLVVWEGMVDILVAEAAAQAVEVAAAAAAEDQEEEAAAAEAEAVEEVCFFYIYFEQKYLY